MFDALKSFIEICLLLGIFLGVLGIAYYITKRLALFKQESMKNKNMQIKEVMHLGPNQYIYIVQVGNEYHLFATSKDKIEYCNKIESELIVTDTAETKTFNDYLSQFKVNIQEKQNDSKEI